MPWLAFTLLLNIERSDSDTSAADEIDSRFASDRKLNWPRTRRPDVFFDPRSVNSGNPIEWRAGLLPDRQPSGTRR